MVYGLEKTGEPIVLSRCPAVSMDLPGLMAYAKKQGKSVAELTEEEKGEFLNNK